MTSLAPMVTAGKCCVLRTKRSLLEGPDPSYARTDHVRLIVSNRSSAALLEGVSVIQCT